ncbi:interleukin-13 receptor subunit alpha-1 [Pseudorasbora parva]|uniref:interleukin-13 receptor subunit alpha-1 n=1 Tax=Pseudorasbora parva TaxID=51549 RepID=UPI00351EA3A2
MMCRFWDISLMICFSVSVMFVGADDMSELPPPKNLNFIWETPFRLSLTWEEPEGLDPSCKVNYTVIVTNCSTEKYENKRVHHPSCKMMVANENGLCISVSTNTDNCEKRSQSRSTDIRIPPPPVMLVTDINNAYSNNRMMCTWRTTDGVQDLSFYYWQPENESVIKCTPDETTKTRGCIIYNQNLKEMTEIFYLFKGTHNGVPVTNTFEFDRPQQYAKPDKPHLKIHREGQELYFQTNGSYFYVFGDCFSYRYTYSRCNENISAEHKNMTHVVEYDPACKYRASVQVFYSKTCGAGKSEPSDFVEYGENNDPNISALMAVIIIPLIVSCCLVVSLVLIKRHKKIIFPKIPEPTLFFKDILNNNMRFPEDPRSPAAGRLYVPIEEVVETGISLEPDTSFITMSDVPHEPK